jgi:hypothetical protein
MKIHALIKLSKKYARNVYGVGISDGQKVPEIGIDLGSTYDYLGGLKKHKVALIGLNSDANQIKPYPIPDNFTNITDNTSNSFGSDL